MPLELREEKAQGNQGKAGENGFTPVPGESNGERARDFADGRGNGQKHGLDKEIAHGGMNPNARHARGRSREEPAGHA